MSKGQIKRWASRVRKLPGWKWFDDDTAAMLATLMGPAEEAPLQSKEAEYDASVPPIWETIAALGAEVPDSEWAKIPTDLASNFDKYAAEEAKAASVPEPTSAPRRDLSDPRYEIAPGMVNFTEWSRENIPKGPPAFKVGDRVLITDPLYVLVVGRDCDGTPLFSLSRERPDDLNESERKRMPDWIFRAQGLSADSLTAVDSEAQPGAEEPLIEDHEFKPSPLSGRDGRCHHWYPRPSPGRGDAGLYCLQPRSRHAPTSGKPLEEPLIEHEFLPCCCCTDDACLYGIPQGCHEEVPQTGIGADGPTFCGRPRSRHGRSR